MIVAKYINQLYHNEGKEIVNQWPKQWRVPVPKQKIQQQDFQDQEEEENEEEDHLEDLHSDESHNPSIPTNPKSKHEEGEP